MYRLIVVIAFLAALTVPAQQPTRQPTQQPAQPSTGSNWQHVQALPVGASINVKARTSHASCTLKSVSADSLTCTHGKDIVFQRADILTIKIPHRGRSALIGAAIGAGVGATVGAASGSSSCTQQAGQFLPCVNIFSRRDLAVIGTVAVGVIGAPIGALTDFTKSTVYKAP